MSLVERRYNQAIDKLTGPERVQKVSSLFADMHAILEFQISKSSPDISKQQLRIEVAKRMYSSEPAVLALLKRVDIN